MKTIKLIIQKLIVTFSGSSLLHGLVMAIFGAVASILIPIAEELQAGTPILIPDYKHVLGLAIGAGLLYLFKNLSFGSSSPSTITDKK